MIGHVNETYVCRHCIMGNRKKLMHFILLFLHSKKVFDGRCAKCSRCGKWIRPSKALMRAQGMLAGIFITQGIGFIFCGEHILYFLVFEAIPLAIVLNTVRTVLLIFMKWDIEDDLSNEYKYYEFINQRRSDLLNGVLTGAAIGSLISLATAIFISIL